MTTHATLSPSARYRWQLCPASVKACLPYGGGKSSAAAIDGTHSHTLLEACLKKGTVDDPQKFLGLVLQDHEGMFGVDQDRIDRVRVATDYITRRLTELGGGMVISESRVNPVALLGRDDMSGTVDVQIRSGDVVELIDYKDGMNPVEAENNPQLEQYAFGVLSETFASKGNPTFQTVVMTIIQPKVTIRGGQAITSCSVPALDFLGERILKIAAEAAATDDPDAPFVPGDKQCHYCAHKANCSTAITWTLDRAGIKFEDMTVTKDAAKQNAAELSNDQIRELVEAGPLLRKLIEAAEEEALRRIVAGKTVVGLKVVRGVGRRKWALPEDEIAAKLSKMGVPKADIWETKLTPLTKIEKLTWTKRDGTTKQLSERQREVFNTELVEKPDGALVVVSESDRRAAVEYGDVTKMFAPVVEEPAPALPAWMA